MVYPTTKIENMKKLFIGILAFTLTTALHAQNETATTNAPKKEWKHNRGGDQAMEKLNLTDAQKAQVKTMNDDLRSQLRAVKNDASLSQEVQKEKRTQLMKDHRKKMENILTRDQKNDWKEARKTAKGNKQQKDDRNDNDERDDNKSDKMANQKGHKGPKGKHGMNYDKMVGDLQLTPDQTTKMKQIQQDFSISQKAINENTSLTDAQRKEQMKGIHQTKKNAMKKMLTAGQKAKMKTHMQQMHKGNHKDRDNAVTK